MVQSMTGYGRDEQWINDTKVSVEIRSVNHRFLDISNKMPKSFLVMEDKIKKTIQSFFHRGRVDLFITIEGTGFIRRDLNVDWELLDQYIQKSNEMKKKYELHGDISLDRLTSLEGAFEIVELEQGQDVLFDAVLLAVSNACKQVKNMREIEGQELKEDMKERVITIQDTVQKLTDRRHVVIEEHRSRIQKRLEEYITDDIADDSRIVQEVALLAEKGDITEELTRLASHCSQFFDTLEQKDTIGRKLDFILQEMHRETNTIGSKSTDVQISQWVVLLKSEIEKIKEQVQNVE
ncbi:YicC family protein [Radiobacillus kanasensis]|uniref:YicC/YloC family endoribonuclease n=1 Tax=Radiobacillus kanasensis TaxID=2844358 RepID=UPI001E5786B6|nr:YicC/YloC family endoribonuclease [Radiobacillus kanasensis]UFU00974.1 YicC family protein [Radiobacillus kanasensis]